MDEMTGTDTTKSTLMDKAQQAAAQRPAPWALEDGFPTTRGTYGKAVIGVAPHGTGRYVLAIFDTDGEVRTYSRMTLAAALDAGERVHSD